MAEVRVVHLLIVLVIVGVIGLTVAAFTGWVAIGWFNQKNLTKIVDEGTQAVQGYTPAKSPTEAMDKFREAIQARKYKIAASYCTKAYAEQLTRGHDGAAQLGAEIDHIERYADNKQIKTEKLGWFLHQLDPFPKNFKSGPAPEQKGDKATGAYIFELVPLKVAPTDLKDMDVVMFNTALRPPAFIGKFDLVKEKDEWKLDIPITPAFETQVSYFKDHWKTYHTGLHSLSENLTRDQWDTKSALEREVLGKLRAAKE